MAKNKKLRSGKLRGSPKFKIWFPAKTLMDAVCFDRTDMGVSNLAERMGVSIAIVRKLMQPGYLIRESTADKYAIKLGYHPMAIWDDWFSEEPEGGSNPKYLATRRKAYEKRQPKDLSHISYEDALPQKDCKEELEEALNLHDKPFLPTLGDQS
jgi:hypothetical protein